MWHNGSQNNEISCSFRADVDKILAEELSIFKIKLTFLTNISLVYESNFIWGGVTLKDA